MCGRTQSAAAEPWIQNRRQQLVVSEKVRNTKIISVGDWIDKGKKTREIIEFLHDNQEHFLFVMGNHENFVYKYMRGEIGGVDQELLHTYFDSTQVLSQDAELLAKFDELVALAKPFYRLNGLNSLLLCNPCPVQKQIYRQTGHELSSSSAELSH